jgi:hypothetical protein
MSDAPAKDTWDKLQAIAAFVASIFVPLAVVLVGNSYSRSMKETENRVKYVELAVSILRAEPSVGTAALRGWAVDVLQQQAIVPLSEDAKEQLKLQKLPTVDEVSWNTTIPTHNGNTDYVEVRCRGQGCPPTVTPRLRPKASAASER